MQMGRQAKAEAEALAAQVEQERLEKEAMAAELAAIKAKEEQMAEAMKVAPTAEHGIPRSPRRALVSARWRADDARMMTPDDDDSVSRTHDVPMAGDALIALVISQGARVDLSASGLAQFGSPTSDTAVFEKGVYAWTASNLDDGLSDAAIIDALRRRLKFVHTTPEQGLVCAGGALSTPTAHGWARSCSRLSAACLLAHRWTPPDIGGGVTPPMPLLSSWAGGMRQGAQLGAPARRVRSARRRRARAAGVRRAAPLQCE